jgi:hypothetical protein
MIWTSFEMEKIQVLPYAEANYIPADVRLWHETALRPRCGGILMADRASRSVMSQLSRLLLRISESSVARRLSGRKFVIKRASRTTGIYTIDCQRLSVQFRRHQATCPLAAL